MLAKQKYQVYNKQNVTGQLIQAQQHKHLVHNLITMKKQIDQKSPKRFHHISGLGSRVEVNRQKEIDSQNKKLLNSIMNIMKRRNKSVQQARQLPQQVIGGEKSIQQTIGNTLMSRDAFNEGIYKNLPSYQQADALYVDSAFTANISPSHSRSIQQQIQEATNHQILGSYQGQRSTSEEPGRSKPIQSCEAQPEMDQEQPQNQQMDQMVNEQERPSAATSGLRGKDEHPSMDEIVSPEVPINEDENAKQDLTEGRAVPEFASSSQPEVLATSNPVELLAADIPAHAVSLGSQAAIQEKQIRDIIDSDVKSYEPRDPLAQSQMSKMSGAAVLDQGASSMFGRRVNSTQQQHIDIMNNPILMRGSLNVGYRKNEMIRINQGNKKILQQLRQVKPTVGSISSWKKHEAKLNQIKKNIQGMHLDRKFRKELIKQNNLTQQGTIDGNSTAPYSESKMPISQSSLRAKGQGRFMLPKIQNFGQPPRMSETAGTVRKRSKPVPQQLLSSERDVNENTTMAPISEDSRMQQLDFRPHSRGTVQQHYGGRRNGRSPKSQMMSKEEHQANRTARDTTGGLVIVNQQSSQQQYERSLLSRGGMSQGGTTSQGSYTKGQRKFKSPLMQMRDYPGHVMKRIMKDQSFQQQQALLLLKQQSSAARNHTYKPGEDIMLGLDSPDAYNYPHYLGQGGKGGSHKRSHTNQNSIDQPDQLYVYQQSKSTKEGNAGAKSVGHRGSAPPEFTDSVVVAASSPIKYEVSATATKVEKGEGNIGEADSEQVEVKEKSEGIIKVQAILDAEASPDKKKD